MAVTQNDEKKEEEEEQEIALPSLPPSPEYKVIIMEYFFTTSKGEKMKVEREAL